MEVMVVILAWIGCGFLCECLGRQKGLYGCFCYGILLGIIGIIIVVCLKDKSGEIENNKNIDKYEQLEKLQVLKNSGAITDIEYEVEKQKLLR